MEHEEKALPIENRTLGEYAMKFHAYAKALHYKELEFFTETSPNIIEALISINSKLQQHDAAWGTLLVAREHPLRSQLGGNAPFREFMKSYDPQTGGYKEGMTPYDTYHSWAASQYKEKVRNPSAPLAS